MREIPLFFNLVVELFGPQFAARVRVRGRITSVDEFGSTWMYGVNPALSAHGEGIPGAWAAFRQRIAETLSDLAEITADFSAFEEAAAAFITATDDESVAEWEAARQAIRDGAIPAIDLQHETGDIPPGVEVTELAGTFATEPADAAPMTRIRSAPEFHALAA